MKLDYIFYYIIIILLTLSSSISNDKYIEKIIYFPIKLNFNAYFIDIYIGNPYQKLLLALDQELQVTWADTIHYNQLLSQTLREINKTKLSFRHVNLYGNTISDQITFINTLDNFDSDFNINNAKNISIDDFWFVVIEQSRGYDSRVGGIGLAYKFVYEEYSLIHYLKKNNYINFLSYGFIPPSLIINKNNQNNNNTSLYKDGLIFFGGLPKNYILNKYRYNCKLTEKYNFWSCNLPYILFGKINSSSNANNTLFYENNNYAYFNGAERRILAPEDFMLFLKHNYFENEINNRICTYYLYGFNPVFECICDVKNTFPNITFIFDNYQYKFTSEELFSYYGNGNCLFLIQGNHLRKNNFIFGVPFLNKFISNFDYETKYITFYSEKQIEKINLDKFLGKKRNNIYIIGILIIIVFVGVLMYIRKKRRDRQYKKNLLIVKNKGKNKIKKMNDEEDGFELK